MSNICNFEMEIKATKENCEKFLKNGELVKPVEDDLIEFRNNYIRNIKWFMIIYDIKAVDIVEDSGLAQATISQTLNKYWTSSTIATLYKICKSLRIPFGDIFMAHIDFVKNMEM